jgi:hypothetical protein
MAPPGFGSPRIIFAMKSENVVQALFVSQFCCRALSLIVVPVSCGFPSAQGFPSVQALEAFSLLKLHGGDRYRPLKGRFTLARQFWRTPV